MKDVAFGVASRPTGCFTQKMFTLALLMLIGSQGVPFEIDMACTSFSCPVGYEHRWDAGTVLCDGACNTTDLQTCCVLKGFSSSRWRVQASSSVISTWDLSFVHFFFAENCTADSQIDIDTGRNGNGAAFSHQAGHGALAARVFHPSSGLGITWSSGSPCQAAECFVGYSWEADTNRFPLGSCRSSKSNGCASLGVLQSTTLRVGCVHVQQSTNVGHFATTLRLQLMDHDGSDSNVSSGLWRTAVEMRSLTGGLAVLQLNS